MILIYYLLNMDAIMFFILQRILEWSMILTVY